MRTKVRGLDSLELALEMRKKEERLTNGPFFQTSGSDVYNCFDE